MTKIFCSIIETDCKEIKSSINEENGFLEFTAPKNCTGGEVSEYFHSLSEEEHSEIANKQKKSQKVFRKKVREMIDKYAKEFDLPLRIELTIRAQTKRMNCYSIRQEGIDFHGNLSIMYAWQYFPDELVEKVMRGSVFGLAREYENLWSQIKGMRSGTARFPDGETESEKIYAIPEEEKYHISIPDSEIENINADYKAARSQFREDYFKYRIGYMRIF